MSFHIVGAGIERVVVNGDGSESQTVVKANYQGYTNIYVMSDLDDESKAYVRSWMSANGFIDQRNTAPAPTPTPTPTPQPALDPALNNVIAISPPAGADFAATRQYLLQFRNWQAVTVNGGTGICYVYDGGLVDETGHFYTGYTGNSSPNGSRPTGGLSGGGAPPVPSTGGTFPGGNTVVSFSTAEQAAFNAVWLVAFGHIPSSDENTYWAPRGIQAALDYAWCFGNSAALQAAKAAGTVVRTFGETVGTVITTTGDNIEGAVTTGVNTIRAAVTAAEASIQAMRANITDIINTGRAELGTLADATLARLQDAANAAGATLAAAVTAANAAAQRLINAAETAADQPSEVATMLLLGLGLLGGALLLNGELSRKGNKKNNNNGWY